MPAPRVQDQAERARLADELVRRETELAAIAAEKQRLAEDREPLLITQNGEAKAMLVDVTSYEQQQETLALLKLLAMGERDVEEGRVVAVDEAFDALRAELRKAAEP